MHLGMDENVLIHDFNSSSADMIERKMCIKESLKPEKPEPWRGVGSRSPTPCSPVPLPARQREGRGEWARARPLPALPSHCLLGRGRGEGSGLLCLLGRRRGEGSGLALAHSLLSRPTACSADGGERGVGSRSPTPCSPVPLPARQTEGRGEWARARPLPALPSHCLLGRRRGEGSGLALAHSLLSRPTACSADGGDRGVGSRSPTSQQFV